MSTPNYALASALSTAGWSNAATARRINDCAARRGHRGTAVDTARVGRWIRTVNVAHEAYARWLIKNVLSKMTNNHSTDLTT
ncbi:hypothetical protein [Streptomyces boncukensis]|uniref:Uncharacterized protein n=1 Tax=Streptomyces boncukensis TaxID=2711219 RepID=A0A6G4X541_9ACTN|nr:hypothetical protein [Streptomyces boncukensis]NGO71854.1 hypothetical protein [Streptomyces boncukensis]